MISPSFECVGSVVLMLIVASTVCVSSQNSQLKVAVAEETVRLRSHFEQLSRFLERNEPVGRKIDFIIQEMNREANTIGSKVQDAVLAHKVVDIKSEIEKIREQVQNIE